MATGVIFTTQGKTIMLNRFANASPDYTAPTVFKVGIGETTPALADTGMDNAIPITGQEIVDDCEATTGWVDSADMTVTLNTTTFKVGSGSLNLTKDATASATASTAKTTTSLDFTSKDLSIWIYVADSTVLAQLATSNCLTVRFGSDSSNYYQWTKDKSFFSVGWNLVNGLTSGTASTTGSPAIAACDYTFVGLTATASGETWAAGKMIMDDIKLASSDDYNKLYVSGYPVINESNLTMTTRGLLLVTEANGNPLTEFGMFNTDGTPKMPIRGVHTAINKTTSVQVIYVAKNKIS